jgi:hypothetical protein
MGIRFYCPNKHKLNVKDFQAGRTGICPFCGVKVHIPLASTRPRSKNKDHPDEGEAVAMDATLANAELSMATLGMAASANVAPTPAAKADLLAEAGTAVWYVRPPSGGQFGPADADVMRSWLAEGRVSADTFVWREGWRDWLEAGEVFPQLSPSSLSPGSLETIPGLDAILAQPTVVPLHPQPKNTRERTRLPQSAIIFTALLIAAVTLAILYFLYQSYGK